MRSRGPSFVKASVHGANEAQLEAATAALDAAGIASSSEAAFDANVTLAFRKLSDKTELPVPGTAGTPLVLCSPPTGPRAVRLAIDRGLDGLVWETHLATRLVSTLEAVVAGQLVVPREVWRPDESQELTNREKQTLALVIMGLSNGEIAGRLYVSESTVKSHLSSSFRKLGVKSRAEAARVIADPRGGLGTGILAITPTSSSGRPAAQPDD